MAAVNSEMIALGTPMPAATLPDVVSGEQHSFGPDDKEITLIVFLCNHCPYVVHILPKFNELAAQWQAKGVRIIAINSNDIEHYPQDSPENMVELAKTNGWTWSFLFDESQDVAKAFSAACTPDFFLFGKDARLAYRGEFCPSRPKSDVPVTGSSLSAAVDALLAGEPVPELQRPSLGCNIKWRTYE